MWGVLIAEFAMLFKFHSIRMVFALFFGFVVSLLAFCAGQCDLCSHFFHLILFAYLLNTKKGHTFWQRSSYHIIAYLSSKMSFAKY